ncbi:MAG: hypothetical protein ACUVQK_12625, partial [Thermogutta sp.]
AAPTDTFWIATASSFIPRRHHFYIISTDIMHRYISPHQGEAGRKIVKKCFPRAAEAVISREFSLPPRGMRFSHLRQTPKIKALRNIATGSWQQGEVASAPLAVVRIA